MMMTGRMGRTLAVALVTSALAGCSGMGNLGGLGGSSGPTPLTPAPTTPVQSGNLQPLAVGPTVAPPPAQAGQIVVAQPTTPPVDPNAPPLPDAKPVDGADLKPGQVADAKPSPSGGGVEVSRTDLLGGWRLASGADGCQLSMALTQWSGGYRASTRGCASPELQKIAAWSLSGRTVTLIGNDGSTVAVLGAASKERFNGSTTGGKGISFSR